MREEEVAAKSRNMQVTILQWQWDGNISAELLREQKIEEHVFTDWDRRNDNNRPSLTSDAVAEER